MQVAWFSGNRLGFDADHALAIGDQIGLPGLKVISKLETEFELPTGDMDTSDVFFNRDAWMGFYSDDLGKITIGRQNTLTRDFTANWGDPYGGADVGLKEGGYSNVNNFKQFIFYSGGANGTRLNSAIEWKKKFGEHIVGRRRLRLRFAGRGRQRRRRQRRLDAGRLQEGPDAGGVDRVEQPARWALAC